MKNKSRKNERNPLKGKGEFSYVIDHFGGLDTLSPEGKCADSRFPYLVNMYRDRERRSGGGIETVPGYRSLPKRFLASGERLYGLYTHRFSGKDYLIVHKGNGLFLFSAEERDEAETLLPLTTLAETPSSGVAFGDDFYLLDGERLYRLTSPTSVEAVGDEARTDAMAEAGLFPKTNAYIPTLYEDGKRAEGQNLLTDYYDLKYTLSPDTPIDRSHGLYLAPTTYKGEEALEVYGFEKGRRLIFVPETGEYGGKVLPIRVIAPGAFADSEVERVILSPAVKLIDGIEGMNYGAFYNCTALKEAILYGVETVGADAFALCASLETVAFGATCQIDPSAFYGTTALKTVHTATPSAEVSSYFGEDVTVCESTAFVYTKVGETARIPCMNEVYSRIYTLLGGEYQAISDFSPYVGIYDAATGQNEGYALHALRSAPLVECYLQHSAGEEHSRYVFVTVTEKDGLLSYRDEWVSYTLPLPQLADALVAVTLDGAPLKGSCSSNGYYTMLTQRVGERNLVKGIRLLLPRDLLGEHSLYLRAYGVEDDRGAGSVFTACPTYGGSASALVGKCRRAAVYDGRLFLTGHPDLPRLVLYSETTHTEGSAWFSAYSYFLLPEDAVAELIAHPAYLALLLQGGGVRFVTASEKGYTLAGGFATTPCRGGGLVCRDTPVFPSIRGLYAIGEGKAWEERRLENRGALVAAALPAAGRPSLVLWQGYLALLYEGEIFLADTEATFRYGDETQYEWYRLEGIGHYQNDRPLYRVASVSPVGRTLSLGGQPLLLGEETIFSGSALTGISDTGETVVYGEDQGCLYLLDTDGERVEGDFYPATHLVAVGKMLFFGSADGCVSVFNTDKRGVSPVVSGKALPCKVDEIHPYYYTFDGHRYPSGFATAYADMGVPHIRKKTVKKSGVIRARARGGSAFSVYCRRDGGAWEELTSLTATDIREGVDFTRFSFFACDGRSIPFYESGRDFVDKQYLLLSQGFRAPFMTDGIAYRYLLSARPKG